MRNLIWSQSGKSNPGPPNKKLPLCHLSHRNRINLSRYKFHKRSAYYTNFKFYKYKIFLYFWVFALEWNLWDLASFTYLTSGRLLEQPWLILPCSIYWISPNPRCKIVSKMWADKPKLGKLINCSIYVTSPIMNREQPKSDPT